MASRPTKGDLRSWMRRLRTDMIGLNAALTTDSVHQVKLYISDALASLEEVAGLAEERYDVTIECPELDEAGRARSAAEGNGEDEGEYEDDPDEEEEEEEDLDEGVDEEEEGEEYPQR